MAPLPKPRVPPPPREPGTHTNAEVKEALHARALRRTVIITAVMFLLFSCLAVVSSTAQQYEAVDTTPSSPKLLLVVVPELTPQLLQTAQLRGRRPFARLLVNAGGVAGILHNTISTTTTSAAPLVTLLTGIANATRGTLEGATSLLRVVKDAGYRVVVAAPQAYWSNDAPPSSSSAAHDEQQQQHCSRVGLYDTECSGSRCPSASTQDVNGTCNAHRKYVTCDGAVQLQQDELVRSFRAALRARADLTYVHIDSLRAAHISRRSSNSGDDSSSEAAVARELSTLSEVNLLDSAVGNIALALAERTRTRRESWLLLLVGDGGDRGQQAPVFAASFARGQLVQLQPLSSEGGGGSNNSSSSDKTARPMRDVTDVYTTVLRWFDVLPSDADASRAIGICSSGQHVSNCRGGNNNNTSS